jgi:hypothetical protein
VDDDVPVRSPSQGRNGLDRELRRVGVQALLDVRYVQGRMSTTCTYHCASCGRHFHSIDSFDLHKAHDKNGWPYCLDPLDLQDRDGRPRLEALTTDGICRAYETLHNVTVWTVAGSREKARKAFGRTPVGSVEAP